MHRLVWLAAFVAGCGGAPVLSNPDAEGAADATPVDARVPSDARADATVDATPVPDARVPVDPILVADVGAPIVSLWADSEAVYYATSGSVARRDTASGNTLIISSTEYGPLGLFGDGTYLYWNTGGAVRRSPDDVAAAIDFVPFQMNPYMLTHDDADLYWPDYSTGDLLRAPIATGGTPTILASGLLGPTAIAVTDANVYFEELGPLPDQIRRVPKSPPGGPIVPISTSGSFHGVLFGSGSTAYWIDDKSLMYLDEAAGGFADPLVTEGVVMRGGTVAGGYVYWIAGSSALNGRLRRRPLGGSDADTETLAEGFLLNAYTEIRIGGGVVYWFQGTGIWSVPL